MRQTQAELEAQLRAARKQQENFFRQEHTPSVKSELQALLARKGSLESHFAAGAGAPRGNRPAHRIE